MYTISKDADEINDSRVKDDIKVANVVDEDEEEVVNDNDNEYEMKMEKNCSKKFIFDL